MANTYITKTPSSTTNQRTWTVSCWVKRSLITSTQMIWGVNGDSSGNYFTELNFNSGDQLEFRQGGTVGDPYQTQMLTNARYRDTNGWYHIVVAADTTQGTEANRLKIYVNGEQITSFAISNYPSQNEQFRWHYTGYAHSIGRSGQDNARYFNGSISHFHNIDGTQYQASDFGETDSTTGEWKIKTAPSLTYGSFGTFILKDGNSVTDQSGRGNNWTVGGGTLTKTEDCPSNVFATLNPLNAVYISFLQGNNTISGGNNGTDFSYIGSTLAANSGKFYWEIKAADLAEIDQVGVALASSGFSNIGTSHGLQGTQYGGKGVQFSNGYKVGDGSGGAYMGGFSTDDIMMVALDLDNTKITFGRNGQWSNGSGGADQTYANSTAAFTNLTAGEYYMPAHAMRGYSGNTGISRYNFGNGYFATTAVSSAGTNASGNGIFEYDVPTGYTALSTKGLNL
jgi:hypothetical protein